MKANVTKILDLIGGLYNNQFLIPAYQRMYSWDEIQCRQLWNDILKVGSNLAENEAHFIGSIVYIQDSVYSVSSSTPLMVIDGQQRLTTVTLILIALHDILNEGEQVLVFSKNHIRNAFLLRDYGDGNKIFRLVLSETDRDTLFSLIDKDCPEPQQISIRIKKNYEFFLKKFQENRQQLESICRGLLKLLIVDISLERNDDPQSIFESMNSTGKDLTQADLIRNYVLMNLEQKEQERLYKKYWRTMELDFGQESYEAMFGSFIRHYLTLKTREIPNIDKVYDAFKSYQKEHNISTENLLSDLCQFSKYYCNIAFNREPNKELNEAFRDFSELKADVAYPLLLELYFDYDTNLLLLKDFIGIVKIIESYIFRRSICEIPTNSLNKTFKDFTKTIDKSNYLENIKLHFLTLKTYTRFPNDEEFLERLKTKDLYNFGKKLYYLSRFENFERKEKINPNEYTIEHILPQNKNLPSKWKEELGDRWREIQNKYLHTLGNLTLTGYNSEYSDKSFQEKRDMKGGFSNSPLILNKELATMQKWGEQEIQNRAEILAQRSLDIWKFPQVVQETLNQYIQKKEKEIENKSYSLENYNFSDLSRELFEMIKREVLFLDENIEIVYTKLYIAFKIMNTNFLDIVPYKKKLKLYLNIPPYELQDPRGISRDVSNIGSWGNGDVEIELIDKEDIPYILGLIRQTIEKRF